MPLQIINDLAYDRGPAGIYVFGWNIAPDVSLIRAQTFTQAWEIFCEAHAASLADCDCNDDGCDCEFINLYGKKSTLDVVGRTIRHSPFD